MATFFSGNDGRACQAREERILSAPHVVKAGTADEGMQPGRQKALSPQGAAYNSGTSGERGI